MLERQLMLLKNTRRNSKSYPKILAKKPFFSSLLSNRWGIASVSHPSLIILRAPKHDVNFFSNSFPISFLLSIFLIFGPKKT